MNTIEMPVVNQMPQYVKTILSNIQPTQAAGHGQVSSAVEKGLGNAVTGIAEGAVNLTKSAINAVDKATDEMLDSGMGM